MTLPRILKSLASSPAETRRTEVLLEQSFMSSRPSLEIIDQPIDQLRGCENSAHTHNRAQYAKVSALIKKHGPVIPLIVDPNGEVIDGFLRLQCLKDQGYKTVPTVTVRTNNPADIKTLRLALNRIPLDAGWDKQKLRDELKYLIDVDYDLNLTGFDAPEIDAIIEIDTPSIGIVEGTGEVVTPQAPAICKTGDSSSATAIGSFVAMR